MCFSVLEVVCHDANGFTAADATQLVYVPLEGIIIIVLSGPDCEKAVLLN